MSLDALAAQMNVTDAEVEAWVQKKYPQFLANKTLVKRLYLIEKGVRFSAPFQPKELRSINQLVVGETADIQAIVVQELSTRSYIGCPNDSKKIPDAMEGKEAVCPKCGNIVKPKILQWALYLVGDVTDEIIASFPPSIMKRPSEGMTIVAQGLLGENEEFLVYRWTLPTESKEGASPEASLQTFFKPSVAPATTTSPASSVSSSSAPSTPLPPVSTTLTTSVPASPTSALMCDQCNAGPFPNALALQGHKTGAHGPKKTGKRVKKPGVIGFSSVVSPSTNTPSTSVSTSSTPVSTSSPVAVPSSPVAGPVSTLQSSQPPAIAPTEPDSRPIAFVASPEQALLPITSPEKPLQSPSDALPVASGTQAPTETLTTPQAAVSKEAVKEEIKAVEGASEGSIKFAKVCGLIAKPLQEFKLHFEANFPKNDMPRAIEAAHCTIVDNKVVFTGG